MKKKAALHNLGCKVNAYETEAMQELLKEAGIRCLTRQARSVLYSVAFGQNHAELELFVPWEDLEQAASLQKSLLTSELVEEAPPDSPDEPS